MQVWHFTEMPYPHLPPLEELSSIRVSLPSKHFDPKIGADLYNRYLDEYMIADELGFNHMLNEHHQTATCIDVAAPLSAAILARQTKKGRICILANPVANRGDPLRIAEEMAMIDCNLPRPARRRLRARRAVRNLRRQHQSDPNRRAALGRHRPRGESVDEP